MSPKRRRWQERCTEWGPRPVTSTMTAIQICMSPIWGKTFCIGITAMEPLWTSRIAPVCGAADRHERAFLDYDRDGKLDLIVTRYLEWDFEHNPYCGEKRQNYRAYCHPDHFKPISHLLYRNNGDGTFTDVSVKSGIATYRRRSGLG